MKEFALSLNPKTFVDPLRDKSPAISVYYSNQDIIDMLRMNKGQVATVADKLNITHAHLAQRIAGDDQLREALTHMEELELDNSERRVLEVRDQHIDMGAALRAASFHLTHKGKHRGYADTPQVSINNTNFTVTERTMLENIANQMLSQTITEAVDVPYEDAQ